MALGKPVFCYLRKDLFKYNPIWKHCPIINVNPETLEDSIIKFLKKSKISRHKLVWKVGNILKNSIVLK